VASSDRDRRLLVVLNPRSGIGSALYLRDTIMRGLSGLDVSYACLGEEDDLRGLIRDALSAGAGEVVAAGGDGTVSGVAEAVAGTEAVMGIVPTGTANMVARELGIPLSISSSTGVIRRREGIVAMDALASGERSFVYQVVVGLGADIQSRVHRGEKELLGRTVYLVAMLRAFGDLRPLKARCRIDGREAEMWVNQLIVANAGILGMEPLRLGPGIRPDDGKVEVVALRGRGRFDCIGSEMDMVLGNFGSSGLAYFDARSEILLDTDPAADVKGDGELIGRTPIALRVRPGAVKVIVPDAHRRPSGPPNVPLGP